MVYSHSSVKAKYYSDKHEFTRTRRATDRERHWTRRRPNFWIARLTVEMLTRLTALMELSTPPSRDTIVELKRLALWMKPDSQAVMICENLTNLSRILSEDDDYRIIQKIDIKMCKSQLNLEQQIDMLQREILLERCKYTQNYEKWVLVRSLTKLQLAQLTMPTFLWNLKGADLSPDLMHKKALADYYAQKQQELQRTWSRISEHKSGGRKTRRQSRRRRPCVSAGTGVN
jgi:hypothetical protein